MFDDSLQLFDLSPDPLVALHTPLHLLDTPVPLTSLQWSLLSKPMTTVLVEGYWAHHPKLWHVIWRCFRLKWNLYLIVFFSNEVGQLSWLNLCGLLSCCGWMQRQRGIILLFSSMLWCLTARLSPQHIEIVMNALFSYLDVFHSEGPELSDKQGKICFSTLKYIKICFLAFISCQSWISLFISSWSDSFLKIQFLLSWTHKSFYNLIVFLSLKLFCVKSLF